MNYHVVFFSVCVNHDEFPTVFVLENHHFNSVVENMLPIETSPAPNPNVLSLGLHSSESVRKTVELFGLTTSSTGHALM